MGETYNYAVTIKDADRMYQPYVRTVKASMIKPAEAVQKVIDIIEAEDDHWLWKVRGLDIECAQVS